MVVDGKNIILTDISIHFQTFSACQGKQDVCQQKLQHAINSPWESKPKAVHNDLKSKNPVMCKHYDASVFKVGPSCLSGISS